MEYRKDTWPECFYIKQEMTIFWVYVGFNLVGNDIFQLAVLRMEKYIESLNGLKSAL